MFSACSQMEEDAWRANIRERIIVENHNFSEGHSTVHDLFCSAPTDLRPIGSVIGPPESLARRISMRRAATLGPSRAAIRQVIIKNTQAERQSVEMYHGDAVPGRSQSFLSVGHIPTIAPRRAERIRLETLLADVWTKDAIPYPGMLCRRLENPIRASANSMMRKLSMASIASNFSKRSMSYASTSNSSARTSAASQDESNGRDSRCSNRSKTYLHRHRKVDFHSAPDAFLPQDFELNQIRDRRPVTGNEQGRRSTSSWVKDLGVKYAQSSNPPTPIMSSEPPTPRAHRAMLPSTMKRLEDAPAKSAAVTEAVPVSPLKERNHLRRVAQPSGIDQQTLNSKGAIERKTSLVIEKEVTISEHSCHPGEPMRMTKKPGKVKSMLFRLWSG